MYTNFYVGELSYTRVWLCLVRDYFISSSVLQSEKKMFLCKESCSMIRPMYCDQRKYYIYIVIKLSRTIKMSLQQSRTYIAEFQREETVNDFDKSKNELYIKIMYINIRRYLPYSYSILLFKFSVVDITA